MHELAPLPLNQVRPLAGAQQLLSQDQEAQLFWRLRFCQLWTQVRQLCRTARFRTTLVIFLSLLFWCGLYELFYEGFAFMRQYVGGPGAAYHAETFKLLFHLFFASLNVMLVFSSGMILYSVLLRSPDTKLLLSLPIRPERITLHKFQETVAYSCWGFFLLASPMMLAYGMAMDVPWYYFAMVLPMMVAFVYIPCSLGAVACLLLVSKATQLRTAIVASLAVVTIALAARSVWLTVRGGPAELFGEEWFQQTMARFQFTQLEWLPSSWLSCGLLEAGRRVAPWGEPTSGVDLPVVQAALYLALLISNALVGHLLVVQTGKRWLRVGYSRLHSQPGERKSVAFSWIDQVLDACLGGFPPPIRLLLLKDWRLLRRDPLQWSQFLIFLGLLGLYFLNLDRFVHQGEDLSSIAWVNMVSFLNLAVVGLILSTFTTRFIFPMISLEGQRFWVLGLLPIPRDILLWSKFLFATLGAWIPSTLLIVASDVMLQMDRRVLWVHQFTCLLLCVGLAAIAVGLGAMLPNFRETSPSKIAAGFGGTLNLVVSVAYILLIVFTAAFPVHVAEIAVGLDWQWGMLYVVGKRNLAAGMLVATLVATAATVIPLWKGIQAFRRLELA